MMNGNGQGQKGKEPVDRVLNLFVHTPIGLAVMAWKRMPELVAAVPDLVGQAVAKGCASLAEAEGRLSEEVRKARMIGQVAVTFGGRQLRREVDARLRDARQAAEGVVGFIPGMGTPGGPNGAGEPEASPVSATARPTAPASSGSVAQPAKADKTTGKPAGARKATKAPATRAKAAPARTTATKATRATKASKPVAKASPAAASASAADLPIPEYDGLSASQVVSRLTGLTPEALRAVRSYEEAGRGRRTVMLAIDRLLG